MVGNTPQFTMQTRTNGRIVLRPLSKRFTSKKIYFFSTEKRHKNEYFFYLCNKIYPYVRVKSDSQG